MLHLQYEDRPVNIIYSEDRTKPINELYWAQTVFTFKASDKYIDNYVLKGQM
jgi:hypothetical protein